MMSYKEKIQHPWQSGPTELIAHAIEHLHKATEFDNRIAFLLFDVGVETLFKTYLLLPDEVTGAKTKFEKRKAAVNGVAHTFDDEKKLPKRDWKFHDLIRGLGEAKPEIKKEFDLNHVEFFHEKRNALYHDGNGITIESDNLRSYSSIAVKLLKYLLNVDLNDVLRFPERRQQEAEEHLKRQKLIRDKKDALNKSRARLAEVARLVTELIAPDLTMGIFHRTLKKYTLESSEKAEEYFFQVLKDALPKDYDIAPYAHLQTYIQDPATLYTGILDSILQTENVSGLYDVSRHDPENFFTPGEVLGEEGGEIIYEEISFYELESRIADWLSEMTSRIEIAIVKTEKWLDMQEI